MCSVPIPSNNNFSKGKLETQADALVCRDTDSVNENLNNVTPPDDYIECDKAVLK